MIYDVYVRVREKASNNDGYETMGKEIYYAV